MKGGKVPIPAKLLGRHSGLNTLGSQPAVTGTVSALPVDHVGIASSDVGGLQSRDEHVSYGNTTAPPDIPSYVYFLEIRSAGRTML